MTVTKPVDLIVANTMHEVHGQLAQAKRFESMIRKVDPHAKQRQCNNPEALRYRQRVGEWTVCPDFAEGAKE